MMRDDWGFTQADHDELHRLMVKHGGEISRLTREIHDQDGITPAPEDPGAICSLAEMSAELGARTKVFPKGGYWRSLLERLRELENGGLR